MRCGREGRQIAMPAQGLGRCDKYNTRKITDGERIAMPAQGLGRCDKPQQRTLRIALEVVRAA